MAELQETLITAGPSTISEPMADEILQHWEDLRMQQYIIDAKPLDSILEPHTVDTKSVGSEESRKRKPGKYTVEPQKLKKVKKTTSGTQPSHVLTEEHFSSTSSGPGFCATMPRRLSSGQSQAKDDIQLVADPNHNEELKNYPQHSVGKLFWLDTNKIDNIHWSTAFYVGNSKVVTVAHIIHRKWLKWLKTKWNVNAAVFIPAMIDKFDIYGKYYGHYAVRVC